MAQLFGEGAIEIHGVKPLTETRGVRHYPQILEALRTMPHLRASPVLAGQAIVTFAGKDVAVSLNGMIPSEVATSRRSATTWSPAALTS